MEKIALITILIVFFATSCKQHFDPCLEFQREYSKKVERSDTSALLHTLNAFARGSDCIDILLTRGDLFLSLDSFAKAKSDFRKVVIKDTANVYALYKLALTYQLSDQDDSAVFYFQKALNVKSYAGAIINYHRQNGEFEGNRSKYDIDHNLIVFRQGVSLYYLHYFDKALKNFNMCIDNKFKEDESFLYRGSICLERNKINEACFDFEKARKLGNSEAEKFISMYCK